TLAFPVQETKHCLNYLRQMILCMLNLTLESPNGLSGSRNFDTDRHSSVHVCKDWKKVYSAMGANWERWTNISTSPQN
ncbi:hypothetical protein B0H13DRAFT_1626446, partial [Mycena leptocephala]